MLEPLYFFHIPKTAGTSLRYWLQDFFDEEDFLECFNLAELEQVPPEEISKHRFFSGHFGFELYDLLPEQPNTITWLREPIARTISEYRYLHRESERLLSELSDTSDTSEWAAGTENYIQQVSKTPLPELCQKYVGYTDNLYVRYLVGHAPRTIEAMECNEAVLEQAKQNLLEMLHFGICEWIKPSLDLLCYRLAAPPRDFSLFFNRSAQSSEKSLQAWSEEELAIVREINRYDIALYEFAKEEFIKRFQKFWQLCLEGRTTIEQPISTKAPLTEPEFTQFLSTQYANAETRDSIDRCLKDNFQHQRSDCEKHESFAFSVSNAAFLSGWYPRHYKFLQAWHRWAGPNTSSSVYLPLKPGLDYQITFKVPLYMGKDILQSLHLEIEGTVIPLLQNLDLSITEFKQQPYIFNGIITSDLIKPHQAYTEIIFKTNRVVEAENGSNSFGQSYIASFALSEIQIEPVTETTIANLVIQAQQRKIESTIHTQAIQDLLKETIQDEMKQLQRQNVELQHQLQQSQQQLHQTQKRIEKFKSELEQAKAEIAAMQTSKFWRIRAAWFRFKLMFTSKQI